MTVKMSDVFAAVKVKSYTKCAIPRTNITLYFFSNLNRHDYFMFFFYFKSILSYFVPQEEEFDKREIQKLDFRR